MTNDKSGKKMGETSKSYLKELFREVRWGVRKDFTNKYVEKGLAVEDTAIQFYSNVKGGFYSKNEEFYSNEFISGSPDIVSDKIIDIKSSWNAHTFPFKDDALNKDYFAQVQGYMWLTGKTESLLCYCLMNTPFDIVEDEVRREHWKQHKIDEDLDIRDFVQKKHNFDHIPNERRIKVFKVERDETVIWQIQEKIELARDYYNNLFNTI